MNDFLIRVLSRVFAAKDFRDHSDPASHEISENAHCGGRFSNAGT
jgi:hypothetical protein